MIPFISKRLKNDWWCRLFGFLLFRYLHTKRIRRTLLYNKPMHSPLFCTPHTSSTSIYPSSTVRKKNTKAINLNKLVCLIILSCCCIFCTTCSRQHLRLSGVLILRLSWPPPKPREVVWSHHKSQELLCHRDWCSRREEKLAENQCCVTGKDLQVGGGRNEGK